MGNGISTTLAANNTPSRMTGICSDSPLGRNHKQPQAARACGKPVQPEANFQQPGPKDQAPLEPTTAPGDAKRFVPRRPSPHSSLRGLGPEPLRGHHPQWKIPPRSAKAGNQKDETPGRRAGLRHPAVYGKSKSNTSSHRPKSPSSSPGPRTPVGREGGALDRGCSHRTRLLLRLSRSMRLSPLCLCFIVCTDD